MIETRFLHLLPTDHEGPFALPHKPLREVAVDAAETRTVLAIVDAALADATLTSTDSNQLTDTPKSSEAPHVMWSHTAGIDPEHPGDFLPLGE